MSIADWRERRAARKAERNDARATPRKRGDGRQRMVATPEGIAMPLVIASRGARAGALMLDLLLIAAALFVLLLGLIWIGLGTLDTLDNGGNPALELIVVLLILVLFLARFGYFTWFELGPRGATPGKRALGIRVIARPEGGQGGRLTAEAVIARNLMRDVEVFLPLTMWMGGQVALGISGAASTAWVTIFLLFPFFNRDNLRAGDIVAGTWVVEVEKRQLREAMSAAAAPRAETYRFGEAELSIYGEHELKVLEGVLREDRPEAMQAVMEAICRKIGWEAGSGYEREFLEDFYAALRAHLERQMRFGIRKQDKFDA